MDYRETATIRINWEDIEKELAQANQRGRKNSCVMRRDAAEFGYIFPSAQLLHEYTSAQVFMDHDRVIKLAQILQSRLELLKIDAEVFSIKPTSLAITFSIRPAEGISIKTFMRNKLEFDICLASPVEITPGRKGGNTVDITIKNLHKHMVGLRSVIETEEYMYAMSPLMIAAGCDAQGDPLCFDLLEARHVLIAGATGSGKSVFIDDILISILFRAAPEEVKLLLIDPMGTHLSAYNGIAHLLEPAISEVDDALDALAWLEDTMMLRIERFSDAGVRNLDAYNHYAKENAEDILPRIVVVVDEYSELMRTAPDEMNDMIDHIVSLGRATGVHLVLATQLPVSSVITPHIKNNIRSRASFAVIDERESRILLEQGGEERLLGSGDMILSRSDTNAVRAQAAYVSETEVRAVTDYVRKMNL